MFDDKKAPSCEKFPFAISLSTRHKQKSGSSSALLGWTQGDFETWRAPPNSGIQVGIGVRQQVTRAYPQSRDRRAARTVMTSSFSSTTSPSSTSAAISSRTVIGQWTSPTIHPVYSLAIIPGFDDSLIISPVKICKQIGGWHIIYSGTGLIG